MEGGKDFLKRESRDKSNGSIKKHRTSGILRDSSGRDRGNSTSDNLRGEANCRRDRGVSSGSLRDSIDRGRDA